jgi:serine/threonine protein phosphatase PrpC
MRALTRSVGILGTNDPEVNADWFFTMGDRFIVCTDGLHGVGRSLSINDVRQVAQEEQDTALLASRLISEALNKGGQDNITGVVVQVTT